MEQRSFFPEGALGGQGADSGIAHGAVEGLTEIRADAVIFRRPVVGTRSQLDPHGRSDVGETGASGLREME